MIDYSNVLEDIEKHYNNLFTLQIKSNITVVFLDNMNVNRSHERILQNILLRSKQDSHPMPEDLAGVPSTMPSSKVSRSLIYFQCLNMSYGSKKRTDNQTCKTSNRTYQQVN
jgi:hypothetical protein